MHSKHQQLEAIRLMLGVDHIPPHVKDIYDRVRTFSDSAGAQGDMTLGLICLMGSSSQPATIERQRREGLALALEERVQEEWGGVPLGVQVEFVYRDKTTGMYQGLGEGGKLRIKIDGWKKEVFMQADKVTWVSKNG